MIIITVVIVMTMIKITLSQSTSEAFGNIGFEDNFAENRGKGEWKVAFCP